MNELEKLVAATVRRLNRLGDYPLTAAELAGILEQEMRGIELDRGIKNFPGDRMPERGTGQRPHHKNKRPAKSG